MKTIKKVSMHLIILAFMCVPLLVYAVDPPGSPVTPTTPPASPVTSFKFSVPNPLKGGEKDLMSIIVQVLNNIVLPAGTVACVMYIIWAGFKFVTAQGNPKEVESAKESIKWAIVGTAVLLGSAGIAKVVQNTVEQVVKI